MSSLLFIDLMEIENQDPCAATVKELFDANYKNY